MLGQGTTGIVVLINGKDVGVRMYKASVAVKPGNILALGPSYRIITSVAPFVWEPGKTAYMYITGTQGVHETYSPMFPFPIDPEQPMIVTPDPSIFQSYDEYIVTSDKGNALRRAKDGSW